MNDESSQSQMAHAGGQLVTVFRRVTYVNGNFHSILIYIDLYHDYSTSYSIYTRHQ